MYTIPYWALTLYVATAALVAVGVLLFYCDPTDKSCWRSVRRLIWLALPGNAGRLARITYARKEVRYWVKHNKKNLGIEFRHAAIPESYESIMKHRRYGAYLDQLCPHSRSILGESLWMGMLWLPLLLYFTAINITYLCHQAIRHYLVS